MFSTALSAVHPDSVQHLLRRRHADEVERSHRYQQVSCWARLLGEICPSERAELTLLPKRTELTLLPTRSACRYALSAAASAFVLPMIVRSSCSLPISAFS